MEKLYDIHSKVVFYGGDITTEEIQEQKMSVLFIEPNDRVLELGGNIGRNSIVIASLLKDSDQLTVLESNPSNAEILKKNRDANDFEFEIMACALSKRPLIQQGWNTRLHNEKEIIPQGWSIIDTIDLESLRKKMSYSFNVVVCDCEGCLYQILIDEPSIFDNVSKVILENDFGAHQNPSEAENYVKNHLLSLGFHVVYRSPLLVYTPHPEFWQVWQR